ncbi:MAG: hypothetical protein M3162_04890 [Thermoproteota archaeon]|nr:hypothetical protein [Thermoproteota archaeon]
MNIPSFLGNITQERELICFVGSFKTELLLLNGRLFQSAAKPIYIGYVYIQLQMYTYTWSKNSKNYFVLSFIMSILVLSSFAFAMEVRHSFAQENLCSGSPCSLKPFNPSGQLVYYKPDSIPNYFAINK